MSEEADKYADRKVVWILGSGFSRSLGGPLLKDLLSNAKLTELITRQALAGSTTPGEPLSTVYRCFQGLKAAGYCEDAEAFLEYVESMDDDPARKKTVEGILPGSDSTHFLRLCRKVIAAECNFVNARVNLEAERWTPYTQWAAGLGAWDRVITFNYDLVLEHLKLKIAMPWKEEDGQVYKLHGSLDWALNNDEFFQANLWQSTDPHTEVEPFIATPGPLKKDRSKKLARLWARAVDALREADAIVFMGYRFPASDAHARTELLGAIRDNRKGHVRVHTVLGPRTHDDDTVRLLKLVEHALRGGGRITRAEYKEIASRENVDDLPGVNTFAIVPQPLYVEDFLSVVHDEELYGFA